MENGNDVPVRSGGAPSESAQQTRFPEQPMAAKALLVESAPTTASTSPAHSLAASDLSPLHPGGLTTSEAAQRRAQFGPNEPSSPHDSSLFTDIRLFLTNPLALILLVAAAIAAVLGEQINAAIIALLVVLSVALNTIQTRRSQHAAARLREQVAPTATVLRDGAWMTCPRNDLVPGDVIRLAAGDLVPADARLLAAKDLHVQQAALTGESLPVEKEALTATTSQRAPERLERPGATISAIGDQTRIQADTPDAVFMGTSVVSGTATAVVTATGRTTAFGAIAARLATRAPETEFDRGVRRFGFLIMRTVVFLVLFVLLVNLVAHRNPLESLLFAVALAVGLTPEFLPMITTVTLGQGALRMAKHHVIVKHLAAIQNFGSMDILCSDKTGTLTQGVMALEASVDVQENDSAAVFTLAYLNSSFETGIKSPLDDAILGASRSGAPAVSDYQLLDELPFDFERRRLSVVLETQGAEAEPGKHLLITKGAPESVLPQCSQYVAAGANHPLDADARSNSTALYRRLSAEGKRVLAIAFKEVSPKTVYTVQDEQELILSGYLAFADPPLLDAADTLAALQHDGVTLKVLSGDNELVVEHVCTQVGLTDEAPVCGTDLDALSDIALGELAEKTHAFARISPEQKTRIVLALKRRGHVVGFLGDGVNDAPSLHAADVGISVASAVDVAKDAAEIILLEHSLHMLHQGILEGRKAFGNVMKYLLMGTSSNFGNMFSMAGASLFLPFLPMLPTQILLNNFLYDLAQVTIPTDTVDPGFIQKPHRWNITLIWRFMVYIGPISSLYDFLTFYLLLGVLHAGEPLFHTGWFVESLATQTLVLFVIRTFGAPWKSRPSRPLTITTLLIVAIGCLLPFTPLAGPLGFTPLPGIFFLLLVVMTGTYLLFVEIVKRLVISRLAA